MVNVLYHVSCISPWIVVIEYRGNYVRCTNINSPIGFRVQPHPCSSCQISLPDVAV